MSTRKTAFYEQSASADNDELVISNLGLVKRIAGHLNARLPSFIAFDDLLQAGMIGLIEAARSYDAGTGVPFTSFARLRIKGAMIDYVRKLSATPRSTLANKKALSGAAAELTARLGRPPRPQELAAHLKVDVNSLQRDIWETGLFETSSIEDAPDEVNALTDDSESSNPEKALEKAQISNALIRAIEELPERKQLVLSLYYVEELTLKEIGTIVGVTESRVSQILSETAALLHAKMR